MEPITHTQPQLLRRNTRDGKIAGVAAGLGDYFRVDPVVMRLAFILLVLAGGFGLLVYALAWLVIPPADPTQDIAPPLERRLPRSRWNIRSLAGGLLVAVGAIAFLAVAGSWWLPNVEAWPLILIAAGAGLLLLRARRDDADPPATPPGAASPEDPVGDESRAESAPSNAPADTQTEEEEEEEEEETGEETEVETSVRAAYTPRPSRRRVSVAWITLGALVIAGAVAALLDNLGTVDISAQTFLLVALAICGAGLVASAFFGRRLALVGLLAVVAAGLAVASLPDAVSLTSGAGERVVRPTSISELERSYELAAGTLTLDLRELTYAPGETLIEANVGVGELIVLFPADVHGTIAGHATVGEVELFGRTDSGVSVSGSGNVTGDAPRVAITAPGLFPIPSESRIVVDAEVGIGRLEARRAA